MNRDRRSSRHRRGKEQPRERAVIGRNDGRRQFLARRVGGEEIVRVERRGIDRTREEDLRAECDADFIGAILRRDGGDAERDRCGEVHRAFQRGDMPGRVGGLQLQRV